MIDAIVGTKVTIFLKNSYRHEGIVEEITDRFLTIKDSTKQLSIILNIDNIDRIIPEQKGE